MSENSVDLPLQNTSKKNIRNLIKEKLTVSLADFRTVLGDKKFDNQIRKTARRLGADVAKAMPKKKKSSKTQEA